MVPRRRVVSQLMILGNIGVVAAASSTIIGFRGSALGHAWWRIALLAVGMVALVALSRNHWVDQWLTGLIGRLITRHTDLHIRDEIALLDLSGAYAIHEMAVRDGDWIARRTLAELELRGEGVLVLGVKRADGRWLGAATGTTPIQAGDTVTVYGDSERIRDLDHRAAGAEGDRAHRGAVASQHDVERDQDAADQARASSSR